MIGTFMVRWRCQARHVFAATLLAGLASGCGGGSGPDDSLVREVAAKHIHGLGVDPRDRALLIATHRGVFRLGEGDETPARVGDLRQDTMGFTVTGPGRALASGHPDLRFGGPSHLGLITSRDGAQTWRPVSLSGQADLHAITANDLVLYAADAKERRLLASGSGGRTWVRRRWPGEVHGLAVHPSDPLEVVVSTQRGVLRSVDGAATWNGTGGEPAASIAWPAPDRLYAVRADGETQVSADGGRRWSSRARIDAQLVAVAASEDRVYVADAEGRIFQSTTGGRTWELRARSATG